MPSRRTSRRIRSALHLVLSDFDNDANSDGVNESTASTRGGSSRSHSSSVTSCAPKPIYIYPGLLRIVRHSAIALDARCPASIYRPDPDCNQLDSCAICLEQFHARDLIRRLPCNKSHIFHSLCLLKWLKNNDRCPLCMDTVSAHPVKRTVKIHQVTPPPPAPEQLPSQSSSTTATDTTGTSTENESTTSKASELKPPVPAPKQKKGPRTYSYIVHDAVRMQVDLAG